MDNDCKNVLVPSSTLEAQVEKIEACTGVTQANAKRAGATKPTFDAINQAA